MDPSSLLAALDQAVAAGLLALDLYRQMRAALQDHGTVSFADVVSGSSSSSPAYPPPDEEIWSDRAHAARNRARARRAHERGCRCLYCLEKLRKARELDEDVAYLMGR